MKTKLDKIIKIQKRNIVTNENNVEEEKWEDYFKAFASVNNLFGKEYWEAAAVQSETTVDFLLLYTSKIKEMNTTDYRIVFNKKNYDIIPPIDNVKYENRLVKLRGKMHER